MSKNNTLYGLSSYEDPVEVLTHRKQLMTKCYTLIDTAHQRLQQFPSSVYDMSKEYKEIHDIWLTKYAEMNTEVTKTGGFSMSDLLFVCLCYLQLLQNVAWRQCTHSIDDNLVAVLDTVRFYGAQHTPASMTMTPNMNELTQVRRLTSYLIVMRLSHTLPKPQAEMMTKQKSCQLSCVSNTTYAAMVDMHRFACPPKNGEGKFIRDLELGLYFEDAYGKATGQFVPNTARIWHSLELEQYVMDQFPISQTMPPITAQHVEQFQRWLVRVCSVDASDSFADTFRAAVFEALLPANSRIYAQTRKADSANVFSMTLLQNELGYDVGTAVNQLLSDKVRSIGLKPDHALYDLLVLHMFGYMCSHELRLDFIQHFTLSSSDILPRMKEITSSDDKSTFRLREPRIVRLQRRWCIRYFDSKSSESRSNAQGYWMICKDALHACLHWLWLLREHHEDQVNTGHSMKLYCDRFLLLNDDIAVET